MVKDEEWPIERQRIIDKLAEQQYQKVMNGRPLIYMFRTIKNEQLMGRFRDLKAHAEAAGYNPYYVLMMPDPVSHYENAIENGFDAVSSFAVAGYPLSSGRTILNFL